MNESPRKIIVTGILFFYPMAGVSYQFLHYLMGLRALGHDVVYIEDSSRWVYDPGLNDLTDDASANVRRVVPSLEEHGFGDRWAYRDGASATRTMGMSDAEIDRWYRDADILLNVTGSQEILPQHRQIPIRAYVESDPFMFQVDVVNGVQSTIDLLDGHTHHATFGENIGADDCGIPETPYRWLTTRQPVFMDLWKGPITGPAGYRTITTWKNRGKDRVLDGETYLWTKHLEFTRYLDLPSRRPVRFELAVSDDSEANRLLPANGWHTTPAIDVSLTLDRYRDFIVDSTAEFTVARDQYVRPRTGWFSDRSASFLAAGRPVITQETGFSDFLPTGSGLFGFDDIDGVLAAIDAIESDPVAHSQAAREIAREYFATDRVLPPLLSALET
jgi:hypothetical protein